MDLYRGTIYFDNTSQYFEIIFMAKDIESALNLFKILCLENKNTILSINKTRIITNFNIWIFANVTKQNIEYIGNYCVKVINA